MSTTAIESHSDQMAAAGREFADFWAEASITYNIFRMTKSSQVVAEIIAWNAFLVAKGLKK